jgi:hypothetical protein
MMKYTPEAILVFPAQFHTGGFHYRVADGIGMPDTFSLHQFYRLLFDGRAVYRFHVYISLNVHHKLPLKSAIITKEMKLKVPGFV